MNEPQRRGRGRPVGSRDSYQRQGPVASKIEAQLAEIRLKLTEIAGHVAREHHRQRNEHESLPAVLRRLVAIERALGLREKIEVPKAARRRPLGPD
jgi:hypothetical protein